MLHASSILSVDSAWTPDKWLSREDALNLHVRGLVDYSIGSNAATLRGGFNAKTGKQSVIELNSILVINTKGMRNNVFNRVPTLTRELLFSRDKHTCAYCGDVFKTKNLTQEHIHPESRGGETSWGNLVAACVPCNQKKANRRPEEAGMELLYVPYIPNHYEIMILDNRNILADQMEFLMAKVPRHSRLRN